MTGAVEPSGAEADEGAGGSVAAWGAVESAGAPAAGFVAFASLCSGALSLFMIVVTRTAFCGGAEIKLNSNRCCNPKTCSENDSQLHNIVQCCCMSLFKDKDIQLLLHCLKKKTLPESENKRPYLPFSSGKVLFYLCAHVLLDVLI